MPTDLYLSHSARPIRRLFATVISSAERPLFDPTTKSYDGHEPLRWIAPAVYIGREFRTRKVAVEVEVTTGLLGGLMETFTVTEYRSYPAGSIPTHCACSNHSHGVKHADDAQYWDQIFVQLGTGLPHRLFIIIDGILYLRGTVTSPPRRVLVTKTSRSQAIHDAHHQCGHRGREPTYWQLSQRYFWFSIYDDVADFVHKCLSCQHAALLIPGPECGRLFIIEIYPMLRGVGGHEYLFVAYDPFLDVYAGRASRTNSPEALANFLEDAIIRRYGTSCAFAGPHHRLLVNTVKILRFRLGRVVSVDYTFASVPSTLFLDSVVLCANRKPTTWPLFIVAVELALGSTASTHTGSSPLAMMYDEQPNISFEHDDPCWQIISWRRAVHNTAALIACKAEHISRVFSAPQMARIVTNSYAFDLHQSMPTHFLRQFTAFVIGTWVLKRERARALEPMEHHEEWYSGPYVVRRVASTGLIFLSEIDGTMIGSSVDRSDLTVFIGDIFNEVLVSSCFSKGKTFDAIHADFRSRYQAYLECLPIEHQRMARRALDPFMTDVIPQRLM